VKLLIYGHHSHTGFGVVTEAIGGRLAAAGIDVRVLAMNHRGEPVKGPLVGRVWPFETLGRYIDKVAAGSVTGDLWRTLDPMDDWKPDGVLVVADVSGLLNYVTGAIAEWKTVPVWHYCPIEGDNLQPMWRDLWAMFRPVAMSDYGARVIGEHIGREVPRIYHGVDAETFHPVSPTNPIRLDDMVMRTQADCRRWIGLDPARKVILRVDRNVIRKNYDALLRAFVDIARADPLVDLILHCQPIDPEGIDLWQEILRMPEDLRDRVKFMNAHDTYRGLPSDGLAALYNAADLYVSTTGGEGFGLTLIEAMACGVPVITTGWAAEVEVVGTGGVLVAPLHDAYGEPVRYHSRYGMDWAVPDARAFVAPVLNLLDKPSRRRALGAAGRSHIRRFSWDTAAAQFIDLFGDSDAPGDAH
jgi:glycosyltransferase involved in cell wall biosynthesis